MSITIKSGAKVLYQWERGVALTASTPCDILRISREDDRVTDDLYPVISGSTGTALIPDRMLTESGYLHVSRIDHADGSERVLETVRILVRHAAKPQNTASSTKEIDDMQTIRMQMAALERAAREGKFDGKDGTTPHIGGNGNWWLGDDDTGIAATGDDGITPHIGGNGNWYIGDTDTGVKATGKDGITPHVGENGNWFLGEIDTGVNAKGDDGITPHIGENGNWWLGEVDTGTPATGADGITPHIGINGNWHIGDVDTGVLARGLLDLPSIGANGNWFIGGVDTGVAASGGGGAPKKVWYGTCTSSSYNNTKYVVNTDTGDFALVTGSILYVLFKYSSPAGVTLNVDGTGEIQIKAYGTTDLVQGQWGLNEVVGFVYDGEVFRLIDGYLASTSYYGKTKLSSSTSSTAVNLAATPSAVKQAYDLATTANTAAGEAKTAAEGASQPGHTHSKSDITDFPTSMTPTSHNQAASTITAGTFAGRVIANASAQAPGTALLRNSKIVSSDTTPSNNGEICWTYK